MKKETAYCNILFMLPMLYYDHHVNNHPLIIHKGNERQHCRQLLFLPILHCMSPKPNSSIMPSPLSCLPQVYCYNTRRRVKHEVTQEEKKKKVKQWLPKDDEHVINSCFSQQLQLPIPKIYFSFFPTRTQQTSSLTCAHHTSMPSHSAKTWSRCSCADILWPPALPTLPFPVWSKEERRKACPPSIQ